jgi:hypothetical protein
MKTSFKKALKLFKYLAIIFSVVFWIYMIYDDYIFIEKYGVNLEGIWLWFLWYFVYFLGFTFYYWAIGSLMILVYHKLIKRTKIS